MKNLKVSQKLAVSFGTVLILLSVMVVGSIISLSSVNGELEHFYEKPYQLVTRITQMGGLLQEFAKNMLHACVTTDHAETEKRLQMSSDTLNSFKDHLNYLKSNYGGDPKNVTDVEKQLNEMNAAFLSMRSYCSSNDIPGAYAVYESQILPLLSNINATIQTMDSFEDQVALSAYQNGARTGKLSSFLMIVLGIASAAVGIGMSVYITRSLVSCITELRNAATKMSKGDFDVQLTYHSKDELGELSHGIRVMTDTIQTIVEDIHYLTGELANGNFTACTKADGHYVGIFRGIQQSLEKMRVSLGDVLGQINQAADQVSGGSEQVSSGAQALSQGATEQASSVQELAATINEISSHVQVTAQNASRAKEQSQSAGKEIDQCSQRMQEMIGAMEDINQKSMEIGKIIKTIEDIAFQTNILALNAAVEAARAGAAGKGFSVVADEVRNLASKSADASKSTSSLIDGAIKAVENGTGIAGQTAQSLSRVVETTKETAAIVDEIAVAANEQAASIDQITQGIDQISSVVQTNSATAEESAAASEELSGQAQMLKTLAGKFQLQEEDLGAALLPPLSGLSERDEPVTVSKY